MTGCVAINCTNRSEKGFRLFSIPTNVERRKKWLQNLRREQRIPIKSACVCEVHFEDSQFESRRADGWRKLKPNAVPTLFNVPDPPPRKSLYKKPNEVAATCAQKVAEVPITLEMNIDYAGHQTTFLMKWKHPIICQKNLLSFDSEQTARENEIVEENNALRWENEYLRKQLKSARVIAGSSLEAENEMHESAAKWTR